MNAIVKYYLKTFLYEKSLKKCAYLCRMNINHAKAVIARNNKTGEIRSGQIEVSEDYTYYLLKFAENRLYPLTRIEMIYYDMAQACGIHMMPSRLIDIDGESHFLTERYDRQNGEKYHTQTLAAMMPEASSYEDLMDVCVRLHLPYAELEETYRRAVFNILTTPPTSNLPTSNKCLRKSRC